MKRRHFLGILATGSGARHSLAAPAARSGQAGPVTFPVDFGAHPALHTEWWYLTGELQGAGGQVFGFQVTFFRRRTGVDGPASRFTPGQLVFAHAALSDPQARRQRHDQRIARAGFGIAEAAEGDTRVRLRDWSLERREERRDDGGRSRYRAVVVGDDAGFRLDLDATATRPPLLQGEAGFSRKGPGTASSLYYSEPQLQVRGELVLDGRALPVTGRAWLDHEWSDSLLDPEAVGWDWIGMNLDDGRALTAFHLRRADGSTLYAGGSLGVQGAAPRSFGPDELRFTPLRHWQSPASQARYPVEWAIDTPAGRHRVAALFDAQELDSRASTGAFYWEGLSELRDEAGRRLGRGYLEMTGYAGRLRL